MPRTHTNTTYIFNSIQQPSDRPYGVSTTYIWMDVKTLHTAIRSLNQRPADVIV